MVKRIKNWWRLSQSISVVPKRREKATHELKEMLELEPNNKEASKFLNDLEIGL